MEDLLHAVEKQLPLPDMHELQQELHEVRGLWVGRNSQNNNVRIAACRRKAAASARHARAAARAA